MDINSAYSSLAFAIVEHAVKDYKKAANRLVKNHSNKNAYDEILSLEKFFQSDWCNTLLQDKMTGDYIIKNLRKGYGDELYYREKEKLPKPSVKAEKKAGTHVRKSRRI